MQRSSKNKQMLSKGGFTLVELMVAILIFSIIGGILTMVVSSGTIFYSQENSQIENQLDITTFSFTMENDIRKTESFSVSSGCLVLNQSPSNISYCFDSSNKTITRNGLLLIDRVASMTFTIFMDEVDIQIESISDKRGNINTYSQHYELRQGNF